MLECFFDRVERSSDQVIKPVNLEALTKWVGNIPEDVVHEMAQLAPMLSILGNSVLFLKRLNLLLIHSNIRIRSIRKPSFLWSSRRSCEGEHVSGKWKVWERNLGVNYETWRRIKKGSITFFLCFFFATLILNLDWFPKTDSEKQYLTQFLTGEEESKAMGS